MTSPQKEQLILSADTIDIIDENEAIKAKWPKVLVEYVDISTQALVRHGATQDEARKTAYLVVMELAEYRGGQIEYLPKGQPLKTALKHKQIWDEFNGKNTEALATKFGINRIDIYKIIRQQKALHTKKIQHSLFN